MLYCIDNGYNWDGTTEYDRVAKSLASTRLWGYYASYVEGAPGNDTLSNNRTGFSAVPAGHRELNNKGGKYDEVMEIANFWSTSETDDSTAVLIGMWYGQSWTSRYDDLKTFGCSVRCVRDY